VASLDRMGEQNEPRKDSLRAGDFFLAVQGLAMMRNLFVTPSEVRSRSDEMREIVAGFDQFPSSLAIPTEEHDVESGYSIWAGRYDSPNPAIELEEPVVHRLLESLPPGHALDAACGTGRHSAKLAELGHRVVGVDATEAMLQMAQAKVPGGRFEVSDLQAVPLSDSGMDTVVCALALTHVEDLEAVVGELTRVLRPGGRMILSDMHPVMTTLGNMAAFPEDVTRGVPFVANRVHQVGDYLAAFRAAGLSVRTCLEPPVDDTVLPYMPAYRVYPEATRQAYEGLPYLLVWDLERS
jgi:ubiquinone/menaquinone biosynthesis C-methylase UbiE